MTPRQLRRARGLTIDDASRRTGIDSSAWSRFERGIRVPSDHNIALMAKAIGVSFSKLRAAFIRLRMQED